MPSAFITILNAFRGKHKCTGQLQKRFTTEVKGLLYNHQTRLHNEVNLKIWSASRRVLSQMEGLYRKARLLRQFVTSVRLCTLHWTVWKLDQSAPSTAVTWPVANQPIRVADTSAHTKCHGTEKYCTQMVGLLLGDPPIRVTFTSSWVETDTPVVLIGLFSWWCPSCSTALWIWRVCRSSSRAGSCAFPKDAPLRLSLQF